MHRKLESQNIQNFQNLNINSKKLLNNNKNEIFNHLQKSKIDGNYKTKNKNANVMNKTFNNSKINNGKIKKYKTPVRRLFYQNSISKYKKDKNKNVNILILKNYSKKLSFHYFTKLL